MLFTVIGSSAMTHWSPELVPGMINQPFANAEREGGSGTVYMTAVRILCGKLRLHCV
jgi:hypothetical protein